MGFRFWIGSRGYTRLPFSISSSYIKRLTEVEKHAVSIYPVSSDTLKNLTQQGRRADAWKQILRAMDPKGTLTRSREAEHKRGLLYLNDLAAASGGRIFSSEKLGDGTKSLLGELANRYYVTITVPRKNAGSRAVRVRVNRPFLAVFARGSFVEK